MLDRLASIDVPAAVLASEGSVSIIAHPGSQRHAALEALATRERSRGRAVVVVPWPDDLTLNRDREAWRLVRRAPAPEALP